MEEREELSILVDGEAWQQVQSLLNTDANDKVFTRTSDGTVVFGDGLHGQQPNVGSEISVSYRSGGGADCEVRLSITTKWPLKSGLYLLALTDHRCQIRAIGSAIERPSGEKRNRYFYGKLMNVDDFENEQQYLLSKHRRHNKFLHGWGVVWGLEVSVTSGDGSCVAISPGYALDCLGRDLILNEAVTVAVQCEMTPTYVMLRYTEKEIDPISWIEGQGEPSHIEECVLVYLSKESEDGTALAIGRIVSDARGKTVDASFHPPRCQREFRGP